MSDGIHIAESFVGVSSAAATSLRAAPTIRRTQLSRFAGISNTICKRAGGLCGSALGPDTADAACADKRAPHYLYIIHTHTHALKTPQLRLTIYTTYICERQRATRFGQCHFVSGVCVCVNLVMRLQTYKYVCFWRQHTKNTHILFNSQLSINMFTNKPWMCVKCLKYELYVCSAFMMMTVWHHEGTFIYIPLPRRR